MRVCAECGEELKGCACGWAKASDGELVHKKCKKSYESKLNNKPDPQKIVCAHCGGEFEGKPYFKAMDGKYVHFECQKAYESQLYKKK